MPRIQTFDTFGVPGGTSEAARTTYANSSCGGSYGSHLALALDATSINRAKPRTYAMTPNVNDQRRRNPGG